MIFKKNGINNVFVIQFVKGQLTESTTATILTDEGCNADANSLTHCYNNIKLADGTIIRGLTIHDMMGGVACFNPGTKVVVTPYKEGYFLLQR